LPAIIPRNSIVIRMRRSYHLPSSSARRSHHHTSPTASAHHHGRIWSSSSTIIPLPAIIPRNSVVIRMRPYHLPSSSARRRSHHCNSLFTQTAPIHLPSTPQQLSGKMLGSLSHARHRIIIGHES
jgi:hypothetical protein